MGGPCPGGLPEAGSRLVLALGLSLVLLTLVEAADPCFNVDQVYGDQRNATERFPNSGFTISARACQKACQERGPFCQYFSWMRDGDASKQMGKGACWVHMGVTGLLGKATAISGPQNCDPGEAGGLAATVNQAGATAGGVPAATAASSALAAVRGFSPATEVSLQAPSAAPGPVTTSEAGPATTSEAASTPAAPVPTLPNLPTVAPAAPVPTLPNLPTVAPAASTPAAPVPTLLNLPTVAPVPTLPPMPTLPPVAMPALTTQPSFATTVPTVAGSAPALTAASSTLAPAVPTEAVLTTAVPAPLADATMDRNATNATNGTVFAGPENDKGSFPWWGLFIMILGVVICAGIAFLFVKDKKKGKSKKKKKKTTWKAEEPSGEEESNTIMEDSEAAAPMISERGEVVQGPEGPDLFDLIDRNHDGKISASEFAQAMGVQAPQGPPMPVPMQPVVLQQQRQVLVTQEPLARFPAQQPQQQQQAPGRPQGPDLFDLIDRNHDGRINAAEWAQAMGGGQARPVQVPPPQAPQPPRMVSGRPPPPPPVGSVAPQGGPELFDLIDRNHDGRITASEFAQAMGGSQAPRQPPPPRLSLAQPPSVIVRR